MKKSTARKQLEAAGQISAQLPKKKSISWRVTLIIAASLIAIDAGIIGYMYTTNEQRLALQQAMHTKEIAAADKNIATIKAKIVEAKRKEAEARKKQAEIAAKEAAEKSEQAKQAVKTAPTTHCDVSNPTQVTVIVNKKHCINPPSWAPSDLTYVGSTGYVLRSIAATHLETMMAAAATAGLPFSLTSAYRSYDSQVATYNNWVAVNGSQAAADTVSARPGYSEHQTGLAADLKTDGCVLECFAGTAQYKWLTQHAADYGFIERYPPDLTAITGYAPEAWHWRYVGKEVATAMKARGIQTLESYFNVSGGDYAS